MVASLERSLVIRLSALLLFLFAALAAPAAAATLDPLRTGALPRSELGRPFQDRVITGDPRARAAQVPRGPAADYTLPDGNVVEIETSPSYPDSAANLRSTQTLVSFLASRVHGPEMSRLKVYVGKPAEIHQQCGSEQAVACYYANQARMYVPGEQDPSGVPSEYAITHEYGHHIATFRKNALGEAFLFGAEYWASYEHVCAGVRSGEFFPGDQDQNYLDNPGEGFADAYAHLPEHYPAAPFQFNRRFFPDAGADAALKRDISDPWQGPRRDRFTGSLSATRRSRSFAVPVNLDGNVVARLRAPRAARFQVQVALDGRVVDRAAKRISGTLCPPEGQGFGRVTVRVVRKAGAGSFTLSTSVAG